MRTVGLLWLMPVLAALAVLGGGCSRPRQPQIASPYIDPGPEIGLDSNASAGTDGNMSAEIGDDDGANNTSAEWNESLMGEEILPVGSAGPGDRQASAGAAPRAGTAGETWCDLLDAYSSARHCEALRRQRGGLQRRRLLLDAPQEMWRDEWADVQALLRRPGAAVAAPRSGTVRAEGEAMAATVMVARLSGDGFAVEPAGWVEMRAGPDRVGRWEWRVMPTGDRAERTLRVIARPRLTGDGGPAAEPEEHEAEVTVRVRVRPGTRSRETAQAVKEQGESWAKAAGGLAALVTALGALYAAIRKLVRPKKEAKAGEAGTPAGAQAGGGG